MRYFLNPRGLRWEWSHCCLWLNASGFWRYCIRCRSSKPAGNKKPMAFEAMGFFVFALDRLLAIAGLFPCYLAAARNSSVDTTLA